MRDSLPPEIEPAPEPGGRTRRTIRRIRRRTRWYYVLLAPLTGVAALLFGTWLVVTSDEFERWAGRRVAQELEPLLGERVFLTRVELSFWPPGVRIEGLAIAHHQTGAALVDVDEARAVLTWRDGAPVLETVEASGVRVQLELDDQGLTSFRNVKKAQNPKPLTELPFDNLALDEVDVSLTWPGGTATLTDLSLSPNAPHKADLLGQLDVQAGDFDLSTLLDWPDVEVGPDHVTVPALQLATRVGTVSGQATVPLQGPLAVALDTEIQLPQLDPLLRADQALHGTARARITLAGAPQTLVADVELDATSLGFDMVTPTGHPVSYRFGDLVAGLQASAAGVQVHRSMLSWGDQRIQVTGHVDPDGNVTEGRILGEHVSIARILRDLDAAPGPWIDFDGTAEIAFEGTLRPLLLEGSYAATVRDLHVHDRDVRLPGFTPYLLLSTATTTGQIAFDGEYVRLDGSLSGPRSRRGWATADIGVLHGGSLDLHFDLAEGDLSDFAPLGGAQLQGVGSLKGRLWGPFKKLRAEGVASLDQFSTVGIDFADHLDGQVVSDLKTLHILDAKALLGESRYRGDVLLSFEGGLGLDTDLLLSDGRVEDFIHLFLDLDQVTGDIDGTLSLSGPIYDLTGEAHFDLANAELFGESFPAGTADGYMDAGRFTLDELRLERPVAGGGLWVRGSVERAWALNMEVHTDEVTLQSLAALADVPLPLTGRVSGLSQLGGTLFRPEPRGQLRVVDARYGGRPVADSDLFFSTTDGLMTMSGLLVGGTVGLEGSLDLWEDQRFALDWTLDRFPVHTFYPTAADGSPITATATGTVSTGGSWLSTPGLPLTLDGRLDQVHVAWSRHQLENATPWRYTQLGDSWSLFGFSLSGGRSWMTFDAQDDDGELSLRGEGRLEADLLRAVVPGLSRADGSARISLSSRGKGKNADARLTAELEADLVRHDAWPAAFEDVSVSLEADKTGYRFTHAEAAMGGGTLTGSDADGALGTISADGWMPTRFDLAARATDVQLQYTESLPPAVGDAWIRFDGPLDNLLLAGEIDVREMDFVDRIDWEDSIVSYRSSLLTDAAPNDEEGLFSLDLHLYAPPGTIKLDNNVADATARADLTIVGDTARPGIVGDVVVEPGGSFFLQDRAFRLERGLLAFRDPYSWDPDLDFDLLADITSFETSYRIHYLISGPFSSWRTSTRSDPPLAQADINSLLYFGVTTDDLEGMGELPMAVAQGVADLVLTDLLVSPQLQELSQDLVFFDRIDIVTGVTSRGDYSSDPRLVFEKFLDAPFEATFTGEINLFEIDNQFFRLERRIVPQAKLSAWWATRQRDRSLTIGGAYGIDFSFEWEVE